MQLSAVKYLAFITALVFATPALAQEPVKCVMQHKVWDIATLKDVPEMIRAQMDPNLADKNAEVAPGVPRLVSAGRTDLWVFVITEELAPKPVTYADIFISGIRVGRTNIPREVCATVEGMIEGQRHIYVVQTNAQNDLTCKFTLPVEEVQSIKQLPASITAGLDLITERDEPILDMFDLPPEAFKGRTDGDPPTPSRFVRGGSYRGIWFLTTETDASWRIPGVLVYLNGPEAKPFRFGPSNKDVRPSVCAMVEEVLDGRSYPIP